MSKFAEMKKNAQAQIEKLVSANSAQSEKKSYKDDRLWKPTVDKAGNGYAVIRFLPAAEGEDVPWVQFWDHGFQGDNGKWYIEKSLTSIKQPDPVSEKNSELWNSGLESDKDIARSRKRRLHYVCNIMVMSDSNNPENEGEVFLYKFGKKIFNKIMDTMQPEFEDEKPINPFDFWSGANFKLKIRKADGYQNYDKSEFASPTPLLDGDDVKLEAVYDKMYKLSEFLDPANYKTYAELKAKLFSVIGETEVARGLDEDTIDSLNSVREPVIDAPITKTNQTPATKPDTEDEDEEDTLSFFANLAKE
jgi:hypothetical protein